MPHFGCYAPVLKKILRGGCSKIYTDKVGEKGGETDNGPSQTKKQALRFKSAYTRIKICLYSDSNPPIPGLKSAYTQIQICLYPD
jgi:hypothetical protein